MNAAFPDVAVQPILLLRANLQVILTNDRLPVQMEVPIVRVPVQRVEERVHEFDQ
ncbi:hypothetical protein D3C73_1499640 [compost metagenome]